MLDLLTKPYCEWTMLDGLLVGASLLVIVALARIVTVFVGAFLSEWKKVDHG